MVRACLVQGEKEAGRQTVIQVYGYTPNYPRFRARARIPPLLMVPYTDLPTVIKLWEQRSESRRK